MTPTTISKKNDEDAPQELLLNSLEPALAKDLKTIKEDDDSFAAVFIKFINHIEGELKAISSAAVPAGGEAARIGLTWWVTRFVALSKT